MGCCAPLTHQTYRLEAVRVPSIPFAFPVPPGLSRGGPSTSLSVTEQGGTGPSACIGGTEGGVGQRGPGTLGGLFWGSDG